MKGVVHGINAVSRPLLAKAPLLQPAFPLIECLGDNLKVRVAEEQPDNCPVHLALLLIGLLRDVVSNVFLAVALSAKEIFKCLNMTAHLISFKNNLPLSINSFCKPDAIRVVSPFPEKVSHPSPQYMSEHPRKVFLLEMLFLCSDS
jgi:hypothetical protein